MTVKKLELPQGWTDDVIIKIFYSVPIGVRNFNGLKDYYSTGSVKESKITSEGKFNFQQKPSRANRLAKKNDVFQARMEKSRKSLLIDDDFNDSLFSTGFMQFRALENCSPKFLFYLLTSGLFLTQRDKLAMGSTQKSLNDLGLKKIIIPLAPLNEQKRIVSKIEELFSKIDSAKQLLEHTKLQLEQYRFSLLKFLFEGKEWKKIKIGEHLNFQYGKGLPKKDRKQGNIPVYGSSGIAGYHNKALVETPSLIVGRKGSAGSVHLVDQPFWPIDTTYFIEETTIYNLKFLYHLLIHLRLGSLDSSTAIPSLRRDDVYALEIPLPSIEEQEQIVSQIEQSFSLLENTQNIVNSTLQTLEIMQMSVLKQAFEGKLVPQDPNDEPAEILLEQIKKQKL